MPSLTQIGHDAGRARREALSAKTPEDLVPAVGRLAKAVEELAKKVADVERMARKPSR